MAGISMCTQSMCPNAGHCYRVQAERSTWQSWQDFEYTVGMEGVVCGNYLPLFGAQISSTTKPKQNRPRREASGLD